MGASVFETVRSALRRLASPLLEWCSEPRDVRCIVLDLKSLAISRKLEKAVTLKTLTSLISGSRPFWPSFPIDY